MAAPLTVGSWVHGWLAVGPTVEAVRAEAERVRAWAEGVFAAAGRSVPDLWRGRWAMSRCRALDLARQVEGLAPMGVETEVTLGPCVVSAGGRGLRVRGRADVVLQLPRGLLVLDYKTGEAADLRADHVLGGRGLQVVLYALALSAERGVPVSCAIVRPGCPLAEPLDPGEVAGLKAVLEELAAIGHRGVLGPPFWPAQQQTDRLSGYPLAVMPLPYPLFAGRWELTHPGLEAPK